MAVPKAEKSDRLKNVEATFGPGSPARMLLEIDVLTLELELAKLRKMAVVVTRFSALPEPVIKKTTPPTP